MEQDQQNHSKNTDSTINVLDEGAVNIKKVPSLMLEAGKTIIQDENQQDDQSMLSGTVNAPVNDEMEFYPDPQQDMRATGMSGVANQAIVVNEKQKTHKSVTQMRMQESDTAYGDSPLKQLENPVENKSSSGVLSDQQPQQQTPTINTSKINLIEKKDQKTEEPPPVIPRHSDVSIDRSMNTDRKMLSEKVLKEKDEIPEEYGEPIKPGKKKIQLLAGLEFEKHSAISDQTPLSIFYTVVNYIYSDIQKKTRSFKIGVFTIFIVVSFITMLKSLVDVAPIAFLKVGQDQVGAIDFKITSDYSNKFINADLNVYADDDPFAEIREDDESDSFSILDYFQTEEGQQELVESGEPDAIDSDDHYSVFGFSLLNFDNFKSKLDPLNESPIFKGFSPRWTLPMKLRNATNPDRNTSCILIIVDSEREINFGFANGFSKEILGDSEIMLSDSARRHLNVTDYRKEKIELFFDVIGLLEQFASFASPGVESTNDRVNSQVNSAFQALLPSPDEIAKILREQFNLTVSADNTITIDVNQVLQQNLDFSGINITVPTPDISNLFPNIDLETLSNINISTNDINNPLNGINLKDFVDGDIVVPLDGLLNAIGQANVTKLDIPIEAGFRALTNFDFLANYTSLAHDFTVIDSFKEVKGKFGNTLGNVAMIDCKYANMMMKTSYTALFEQIVDAQPFLFTFLQTFNKRAKSQIEKMDFCKYVMSIEGVLDNQVETYSTSKENQEGILGGASNDLASALTYDSFVRIDTPLKRQLRAVEIISIMMSSQMTTIIAFLAILSTQLIYSLMLSDVEEKTYEFGMLRALGFNTSNIMFTIIIQATMFMIPGVISGIGMSSFLNGGLRHTLYTLTDNYYTYALSNEAIWVGVTIGVCIPMLSNIVPIQAALGKNLRASLDLYHRQSSELTVSIQKLANVGLSVPQLIMAAMLVILGVLTYYVAPASFLFRKFEWFFLIMNGLLLMMIIGLTFISILLLPMIQKGVVYMFTTIYYPDTKMRPLVLKNMQAHDKRNTKTATMFAVCLSFLIFAGSIFSLLGDLIKGQLENSVSSDLIGINTNDRYPEVANFFDEGDISMFLEQQKELDDAIVDYTFISFNMQYFTKTISGNKYRNPQILDMAGYKDHKTHIFAVKKNYLDVATTKFYYLNEIDQELVDEANKLGKPIRTVPKGDYNAIDALYSDLALQDDPDTNDPHELVYYNDPENFVSKRSEYDQIKLTVPEGFRDTLSLDTGRSAKYCVHSDCKLQYRVKVRAMLTKMPSFRYTAYQSAQFFNELLTTEEQFKQILDDFLDLDEKYRAKYEEMTAGLNVTNGIPKRMILVKLNPNITQDRADFIANGIRSFFKDERTILIDLAGSMVAVQSSLALFQIFVGVVGTIALILAFFLLLISTTQNIRENVWEYGCLRAIGFTKQQGMRMFMYEQYAVIISSLILGTGVGFILASIVTAQFFLFLEEPFRLNFPFGLLYAMGIMAISTTFFAVWIPVKHVNSQKVATTIKGLS